MKRLFLLTIALSILIVSCQNKQSHPGYITTDAGLNYKFYVENEGEVPQMMEYMDVVISCTINDSLEFMPKNRMILQMIEPLFSGDIYDGIKMMHRGDSASFIVRTDSTLYTLFQFPVLPPDISADDIMRFEVKMNDIYPESEFITKQIEYMKGTYKEETEKSEKELAQYFKENNINVQPTSTGLYYRKIKDGNGERPLSGTMVKVHYTGKLLDGTVFDSSVDSKEPFQFVLGVGQVIFGWDEGIQLMSKGEKGILYIPYYLAYGDMQAGPIPPFSTLIFEVELIDF